MSDRLPTNLPGDGLDARLAEARAESERLSELLALARDFGRLGIWERDVRTLQGRWDAQVYRFWGLDPGDGTPDFAAATRSILDEDRAALEHTFLQSLKQAGTYAHRYRVRHPDGALRQLHSQWMVKNGADGQPERVLGIMVDDTEAWSLAHSFSALESQLGLAVDLVGIGLWRHDLQSGLVRQNRQGWALLGMAARDEGVPIENMRALMHPDDAPRVRETVQRALTTSGDGRPIDIEARHRMADGRWRTLLTRRVVERDDSGRPLAFVGVVLDVTERRQTDLALRRAAERATLSARGAGLGTWETDLISGQSTWDEQMYLLRGMVPADQPPDADERLALVHPDDREDTARRIEQETEGPLGNHREFRIVRVDDGSVRWLASRTTPVFDEQGRLVRRIGVNWDVTDTRNAEGAQRERELAQRESRAKSQFLARMSHELRTPLNAVLGFTQLLAGEETDRESSRSRWLAHVRSAGEHLLSLIDGVLDLTSLEGGEMRVELAPVPLARLVAETLPLVEPLRLARGVTLHTGDLSGVPLADPTRLRQVLLNLLSNAIKYNRQGGQVTIEGLQRSSTVLLRVSDTGRGMTDAQQRRLFEPFNRLGVEREGIEGTGIGLVIVKALVERMGGSVHVDSTAGLGSMFEVRLTSASDTQGTLDASSAPAADDDLLPAAPAARTRPAATPAGARPQLLYIEDNPVNAMIVAELVARRPDLQLHLAVDGRSGLERALALRPALVLLDMQLPDFDGHEVLKRLRADERTAAIPVIALSANAMPHDIQRALAAGISDYWTKPLDFRAFMASLDAFFGPPPG